jgi:hypothetical protein
VKTTSWFGVGLILTGSVLLLHRLDYIDFGVRPLLWSLVALFGVIRCVDGFRHKRPARVFWGAFLFFFGSYGLTWYVDAIDTVMPSWPPALVLMVGASFLVTYASVPRSWQLLVPAVTLTGVGVLMTMTEFGYLYRFEVSRILGVLLPAALILFGLAIILQRTFQKTHS